MNRIARELRGLVMKCILLFVSVACLFCQTASAEDAADTNELKEVKLAGRTYRLRRVPDLLREDVVAEGESEMWLSPFFVHATGPMIGAPLDLPDAQVHWVCTRIFPAREAGKSFCSIFERPLTRKWKEIWPHIENDLAVPWVEVHLNIRDRERVGVQVSTGDRPETAESFKKRGLRSMEISSFGFPSMGTHAYVPEGKPEGFRECLFMTLDRAAELYFSNVAVFVDPNFSDGEREVRKIPVPVEVIVAVREFLEQPFPAPDKITNAGKGRLIAGFALAQDKVRPREPVKVGISFGLDALNMCEMIRLKATNGGFQRQGADILYRPDKPGTHTLTLEAFCGFHHDGKIDFAERREIAVTVDE